jgi:5-methylcytosine-specific restriction endonuclease McrA
MARESISKKLRFEVFKRDSFTCQYCGQKAPDVILEIDHIKPVAKEGTSDILNFAGKSDRELSDNSEGWTSPDLLRLREKKSVTSQLTCYA